jgi:hypothetical protein
MEIENDFVFQIDSELVKATYQHELNYKIQYSTDEFCDKSLCVIYFSSNEIYYPNSKESFEKSILKKDKYEWQNSTIKRAYKHIFVRDIQKQWYIEGINASINTPTQLLNLLLTETAGYTVYTIGSSAGGFAAIVYGSLLHAKRVYAFNAQLNLNLVVAKSKSTIDPLLFKYKNLKESEFFQVDNFINNTTDYFYFQSSKSRFDREQYESLVNKNRFVRVQFNTSNHGFPFFRHNLQHVFQLEKSEIIELSKRNIHPFTYSISCDGIFQAFYFVIKAIILRFKKKMYDERFNK